MAERADDSSAGARVLIAGAGIAAIETVLALRDLAPPHTHLTVVAPDPEFLYKPLTVEEPFTGKPAEHHELGPLLREIGARCVTGSVQSVDVEGHSVGLDSGRRLHHDFLVVCVGGHARSALDDAETFWSGRWDLPVDHLIEQAAASPERKLAFVVPPGCSWPLPLYELALMTRRRTEEIGESKLRLCVYTPERAPLGMFGDVASDAVAALLSARRIEFEAGSWIADDGESTGAGAAIALPEIGGPAIDGLPADAHGFLHVDRHGRVVGAEDVYAAGDATDFPIKQGGLATQQADAVSEHLAARLGARHRPAAVSSSSPRPVDNRSGVAQPEARPRGGPARGGRLARLPLVAAAEGQRSVPLGVAWSRVTTPRPRAAVHAARGGGLVAARVARRAACVRRRDTEGLRAHSIRSSVAILAPARCSP